MHITIATGPWLPVPALQGGAVPRLWQGLAEQFVAKGHQVTILCRSYRGQPHQETIKGVNYLRYFGFSQSRFISLDLLKDFVYALSVMPVLPKGDIFIINDFWLPVFAKIRLDVGCLVINANRFPKGQYSLYAHTQRIVAVSTAVHKAIAKQYPPAEPHLRVIPNPIDTTIFSPSLLPRYLHRDPTILYAGRVHPEKGIHLLLNAFRILCNLFPNAKLRIIGPIKESQGGGGESYFHNLKTQAKNLNVQFDEPVFDTEQLANVYRKADLFCYPSLAEKGESFGVAPLEAMATGLVPVVSDLDCFKDFIQPHQTGYIFNHRSPDADQHLAETLALALNNWEKTCEIAINAVHKAQEFNYQHIAQLYLAVFSELISNQD